MILRRPAWLSLALVGCSGAPPVPQPPPFEVKGGVVSIARPVPFRFETTAATLAEPLPRPAVTGTVATVPTRTYPSFSPLDGRVEQVAVHFGQKVQKGQRLVRIRSADLAGLHRELRVAKLSVQTRQALLERLRMLVRARAAPEKDLLVAQSELTEAKLSASTAETKLRSLGVEIVTDDRFWLRATHAGTVVQLAAAVGKQVGPGNAEPIVTVSDLTEVLVLADLPARDARGLHAGMPVQVVAPGVTERPLAGRIGVVSRVMDPAKQVIPVRIRVPNPAGTLKVHEFVQVQFPSRTSGKVVRVPTEAVLTDGLDAVVFVEGEAGRFLRRLVSVGRQDTKWTEVRAGLRAGERVVTRGALLLLNAVDLVR